MCTRVGTTGRSSDATEARGVPDPRGWRVSLSAFLPRHTVPSDRKVQFEGFPDRSSYRSDRITNRFDADERGAGYAYIYTHCCGRLPPSWSSARLVCHSPRPGTGAYTNLGLRGAGVGAAPTVWCLGCGTPAVGVAVGGRRHAPVPPSLLRGVHRPSINRIYRPTTRNDFKSSVYALCYRKSCWNASRATSAVRETDDSGM